MDVERPTTVVKVAIKVTSWWDSTIFHAETRYEATDKPHSVASNAVAGNVADFVKGWATRQGGGWTEQAEKYDHAGRGEVQLTVDIGDESEVFAVATETSGSLIRALVQCAYSAEEGSAAWIMKGKRRAAGMPNDGFRP